MFREHSVYKNKWTYVIVERITLIVKQLFYFFDHLDFICNPNKTFLTISFISFISFIFNRPSWLKRVSKSSTTRSRSPTRTSSVWCWPTRTRCRSRSTSTWQNSSATAELQTSSRPSEFRLDNLNLLFLLRLSLILIY